VCIKILKCNLIVFLYCVFYCDANSGTIISFGINKVVSYVILSKELSNKQLGLSDAKASKSDILKDNPKEPDTGAQREPEITHATWWEDPNVA